MSARKHTLQEDLLAVFKRACREKEFELADRLLAALEGSACRQSNDELLAQAYLVFADSCEALANC